MLVSEDAHSRKGGRFRVHNYMVGKWILVGGSDRGDVVFIAIYNVYNLHGGLLEGFGHCAADFEDVCQSLCQRQVHFCVICELTRACVIGAV
jgi:hypothetical protein